MSQSNKFNVAHCSHCSQHFHSLGGYNQGKPGTVNAPKLGGGVLPAYGGVGFPSQTKAYQNEGGYATLQQAYPSYQGACNPKNALCCGRY